MCSVLIFIQFPNIVLNKIDEYFLNRIRVVNETSQNQYLWF